MDRLTLENLIKEKGRLDSRKSVLTARAQELIKEKGKIVAELKALGIEVGPDTDIDELIKETLREARTQIEEAESKAKELTELVQSVSGKEDLA